MVPPERSQTRPPPMPGRTRTQSGRGLSGRIEWLACPASGTNTAADTCLPKHPDIERLSGTQVITAGISVPDAGHAQAIRLPEESATALISSSPWHRRRSDLDLSGGTIPYARVALGGVGTKPWRSREAERVLTGKSPSAGTFGMPPKAALAGATPHEQNRFKIELARRNAGPFADRSGGRCVMIPTIGEPHDRVDGRQKVTGEARYAARKQPPQYCLPVLVTSTIPREHRPRSTRRRREARPAHQRHLGIQRARSFPTQGGLSTRTRTRRSITTCRSRTTAVHYLAGVAAVVAEHLDTHTHGRRTGSCHLPAHPAAGCVHGEGTSGDGPKSGRGTPLRHSTKGGCGGSVSWRRRGFESRSALSNPLTSTTHQNGAACASWRRGGRPS